MAIKQKVTYETSDGTTFVNLNEATIYEDSLKADIAEISAKPNFDKILKALYSQALSNFYHEKKIYHIASMFLESQIHERLKQVSTFTKSGNGLKIILRGSGIDLYITKVIDATKSSNRTSFVLKAHLNDNFDPNKIIKLLQTLNNPNLQDSDSQENDFPEIEEKE